MKIYLKLAALMMCVMSVVESARSETCVTATHSVFYDCGSGTVAGTLPSTATATYGASFTPTMLTTTHCSAPSGQKQAGIEIWVDGKKIDGFATTVSAFTYYYASDITIRPHYVSGQSTTVGGTVDADTLWSARGKGGDSYTYNASAMTWQTVFSYGTVSGVAACSKQKPQNTADGYYTGYIADDQDAIVEKEKTGQYCYCKLSEPSFAGSPWVFCYDYGSASDCASRCADYCGYGVRRYAVFRGSVFRGARP